MTIETNRLSARVRDLIPVTWDAMSQAKQVEESVLLGPVEYACALYLGEDEPSDATLDGLSRLVIEFVAKFAALELIGPAIDFWMDKKTSITTTGTNETVTYADRIKALENQREVLIGDLAKLEPIVAPLLPELTARKSNSGPKMSTLEDELLTPNPQDFGRMYAEKTNS